MASKNRISAEQLRANMEAAGIPDSKPFIADEPMESGVSRIRQCHIDGKLVDEMNLAPQVLAVLDYWSTDEGIAEKNSRPNVVEPSGISLGADPHDKARRQRRDDVMERGMDLGDARDPLKEVADRYAQPGMRPKFLSSTNVKDASGAGDYRIVKDASGEPVRVRGLVLGHMPEEKARARTKRYQARGNTILKEIGEQYKREGGETAVSDQ